MQMHFQDFLDSLGVTLLVDVLEKARIHSLNCCRPVKHFLQAMPMLGDNFEVSDELSAKCKTAICKLYSYNYTDVNLVKCEMLINRWAESHDIPPKKDALAYL